MKWNGLGLLILLAAIGLLMISCDSPEEASESVAMVEVAATFTAVPTPTLAPTQIAPADAAPPTLLKRTPRQYQLNERRPTIALEFDQAMDKTSVAGALQVEPALPLNLRWDENTLLIEPAEALTPGTQYRFALDDTAVSALGTPLNRVYNWEYFPLSLVNSVRLAKQERSAPIAIRFNYALDADSVRRALQLEPEIVGDLTWNDARTFFTFTPAAPLPSSATYTLGFGGGPLRDANGDALPSSGLFNFTTPSPILASEPKGRSIHPATQIRITFDRPMDEEATAAAFSIAPAVPGAIEWQETTLIFKPETLYFAAETEYSVEIEPAALSADGERLFNEPFGWTFRTGQLEALANFGWGPNAQVVDANGRRAIQFQLFRKETTPVTFDLYRLTIGQFLDRYASGFRGVAGWEEGKSISVEGATLVKSWMMETSSSGANYNNVQELIIPDDAPPGLYILDMSVGFLNDQLILLMTENTVTVKQAEGQIVAWATDINGGPVGDAAVSVYARDGEQLANGRTDANGIFETAVSRDPQPLIVIVQEGNDITASGLSNEWRSRNDQWGWWWQPEANDYVAYVYTDRPIYRPDQTVFFKAIVRRDDDAIISLLPAGTPVTARIRDARNNVVQTQELTANDFGTVNGEFQLAEGAMLGSYAVEVILDGEGHRQIFKVEDYRKPDYQVTVTTNKEQYVVGEKIEVTVDAAYFFGEPVANAQVVINQFRLGERYYWDESSSDDYIWYDFYDTAINGRTDANGRFTFTITASEGGLESDWRSSLKLGIRAIEATVDDGSRQTVSGFAVTRTYDAAEKIRLETDGYFFAPGETIDILAEVVTIADEPVNGRSLDLTLRRWSSGDSYELVIQSASLTTGADGRASLPFTIEEPGYYQLRLAGRDASGKAISFQTYVYAFSDRFGSWYGRSDTGLTISADKESYVPGESARLLIETAVSGPALLTFERGTTRREQLIELTPPVTVVEVPIQADDAPNIYVAVNVWQPQDTTLTEDSWSSQPDSRLLTASVNLSVPVTDKTLLVTITPDKESYAPREEATFTVRVVNEAGTPVSAELSLAMVDEAIFALSADLSGTIFDGFYYERANIVGTFDALALIRYLGGGGGGGGGDLAANPRSDFPDTAEWFPVIYTDFNGEARVTVTLPDSLTSWRLTAKAVTADTQVGETFVNFTTKQEIVVRPILPRTLTAGDTVQLTALVHNYSASRQTLFVTLDELMASPFPIDRLEILSPITQTMTLRAGEVKVVGWVVRAHTAGFTGLAVRAGYDDDVHDPNNPADSVWLPLTIRPLAVPDVVTEVGQFSGSLATTFTLPANALPMSSVNIELSRSIAGTLLDGLEYLTGFPYGCVEQTMSKALPNAVVGRALNQLGVTNPTLQADLPAKVNAGLQKLYGYQHNDGGWGWWYDDSSDDYQTAWVVFGLAVMTDAGYEVDAGVIERGVAWLNENLSRMDKRTRAYALYSMAAAGQSNSEASLALLEELAELDTFSQAGLALALWEAGERDEARAVVDLLAETAVSTPEGKVHWPSGDADGYYHQKTMSSTTRSTALALSALVTIRPGHELEAGMVRYLMAQRQRDGWGTTNETSYAILALTDHLLATSFNEAAIATNYTILLNGEAIAFGSLGRGEPAVSLEILAEQMKTGNNALRITQDGAGSLYYVINNRTYMAQAEVEAAGVVTISREYLDVKTGKPLETIEPGQLIKVRLTLRMPDRASYVIVEDSLPGGLEALNEGLNTTSRVAAAYTEPVYYWQEYGYNYKEIRGDRVSFFITEMEKGQRVLTYIARATHSGRFVAMPAETYAMYDLATWGRSASSEMVVGE